MFFILALTGCIESTIDPDNEDAKAGALFSVEELKGSLSVSSQTALPEKFTLHLKTCIQDIQNYQRLIAARFAVGHNENAVKKYEPPAQKDKNKQSSNLKLGQVIAVTTDGEGCLNWTEEYDYVYNNQSRWMLIPRYIRGLSNARAGTVSVPMAVNPWLQLSQYRDKQVLDYREDYHKDDSLLKNRVIKEDGLKFLKNNKNKKIRVIVDEVDFTGEHNIIEQNEETVRKIQAHITAKVKYIIKDINGNPQDNLISAGRFIIRPDLLIGVKKAVSSPAEEEHLIINTKTKNVKTQFQNNMLDSEPFEWVIPKEAYNNKISLYLQVIPKTPTDKVIIPFEGVYLIGETFKDILSNRTLPLNPVLENNYRQKMSGIFSTTRLLNKGDSFFNRCLQKNNTDKLFIQKTCLSRKTVSNYIDGFGTPGWVVTTLGLRFFGVQKENWLNRKISTIAETFVQDPLTGENISLRNIHITIKDLSTGDVQTILTKTERNGKLIFTIPTEHKWYKKQRYLLKLITFSTKTKEMNISKMIAINPWEPSIGTHAYEVTPADNIRTTCLTKSDEQNIRSLFKQKNYDLKAVSTIKKIFCQQENASDSSFWTNTFREIKNILTSGMTNLDLDNIIKKFYEKFNSVKEQPLPRSFIHFTRSVTKFPTYILNSSLNRDFYYNMRFEITPRVVRYDDIARGQQNKGPLRDGIYVFQFAVLKNNQETAQGLNNMVQTDYSNYPKNAGGYIPLFSCKKAKTPCITKEDFIVHPVNIPVVIRDGKMKSDINIKINREDIIFSNSKNNLVFRILPADPKAVIESGACPNCPLNSNMQYEKGFNWTKALDFIKPARKESYDMFFHTYQTPLILNEWNNWIITNETDLQFETLNDLFAGYADSINSQQLQIKKTAQNKESEDIGVKKLETKTAEETDPIVNALTVPKNLAHLETEKLCNPVSNTEQGVDIDPSVCRKDSHDTSSQHLPYFAAQNSLCVLGVDSHLNSFPESCGAFSSADTAEQTFIDDLNKQIQTINNIRTAMFFDSTWKIENSAISLLAQNPNSDQFKEKIQKMPKLPVLENTDIANIIQSGITKYNAKNSKVGAFTHALCGMWFDQFLTSKYTNSELLLNGFRKSLKKTLYYNLRGLSLPENTLEEGAERQKIQALNKGLSELRQAYTQNLKNQNIEGTIDNLHKWMDDENFDSDFHNHLRGTFKALTHNQMLNNKQASFLENIPLMTSVINWWKDTKEEERKFELADYLYEAVKANKEKSSGQFYSSFHKRPAPEDQHPVRKCLSNPSHFFGFEKKVIVSKINENSHYGDMQNTGGEIVTLNVNQEFLLNSQKDQGARQSFDTGLNTNWYLLALPLILLLGTPFLVSKGLLIAGAGAGSLFAKTPIIANMLTYLLSLQLVTNAGYNYHSYENTSAERMTSLRVSEGVQLLAEHTPITIGLKKYQECLVVRPRFSAFENYDHIWTTNNKILKSMYENLGILLCTEGKNPNRKITEHYYYIYPDYAISGITLDPRNKSNKPFIISLRGKNEYRKFIDSLSCYLSGNAEHLQNKQNCMNPKEGSIDYLFADKIEFAGQLKHGFYTPRLMHLTGSSPGVYAEPVVEKPIDYKANTKAVHNFINFWSERAWADMDIEKIMRRDTE